AEAEIVTEAKDRYLAGETLQEICDDFNARGVSLRNGGQWIISTLARLLRNPSIAGRQMNNRNGAERVTTLEFEPIITWPEHEALVARLDSRARRAGISPFNVFMLSSLLTDHNGHPMYGKHNDGNKKSFYYGCRKGCGYGVPMAEADATVSEAVTDTYGDYPHMVRRVVPGENYLDQIARKRQDIRELDPEGDNERRAELRAEIDHLRSLPSKPDRVMWVPSGKTIAEHWDSLNTAGRRDWLKENGWKVTASKDADGWRLGIDAGFTAGIGADAQVTSLGYPVVDVLSKLTKIAGKPHK